MTTNSASCPACAATGMQTFFEQRGVPGNSCLLLDSADEARACPRGDIVLGFCGECGFISNTAFDEARTIYSSRYEETQGYSPTFSAFHRQLAERLVQRYGVRNKRVIEIGCGKGEFLQLVCELGDNEGLGFDPGYADDRVPEGTRMRVIKDFFSDTYAGERADFLCCKMTLEHIHPTGEFIASVRKSVDYSDDAVIFFQVPDVVRILRDCAFEDIYHEHCSYFSPGSLARLFRHSGFDVLHIEREYGEQYLTVEARPGTGSGTPEHPAENDLGWLRDQVASFPSRLAQKHADWQARLSELRAAERKVVLWGSGSKAVALLNTFVEHTHIEFVVDINPYRHDHYMPGTGQRIVAPEFLQAYQPDEVIVMNAVYVDEIRSSLADMGLTPALSAL